MQLKFRRSLVQTKSPEALFRRSIAMQLSDSLVQTKSRDALFRRSVPTQLLDGVAQCNFPTKSRLD